MAKSQKLVSSSNKPTKQLSRFKHFQDSFPGSYFSYWKRKSKQNRKRMPKFILLKSWFGFFLFRPENTSALIPCCFFLLWFIKFDDTVNSFLNSMNHNNIYGPFWNWNTLKRCENRKRFLLSHSSQKIWGGPSCPQCLPISARPARGQHLQHHHHHCKNV